MQRELPPEFLTTRPIRTRHPITITVGQSEGDLRGNDDKVLQAAVDYVSRLGGGCVRILPGTYTMRNALYLKPGITIRGSGENTILQKAPSVTVKLIREADWYEYCVQVDDPSDFTLGCGVALTTDRADYPAVRIYTVTEIDGNILYLDQRTEKNYWLADSATASTRFSILHALNADDVTVEDIILDGNRESNSNLNGNYGAAVFMQYCDRWTFKNVTARNYNGDGFSFQVCDDVQFDSCHSINNADLGFHPGSGSQRPVFRNCTSVGNSQGIFWCWGACFGIAENCTLSDNRLYGINIGHRDTENTIKNCTIERNGEVGILFREEENEFFAGSRNTIDSCIFRGNALGDKAGFDVDIRGAVTDISIRNCTFENTNGHRSVALRIGKDADRISMEQNTFAGHTVEVEDCRQSN